MKTLAMEKETRFAPWSRLAATVAGGLSAALGLVVLVGWSTQTAVLVQMHPAFPEMQYNTALGFVLFGVGLLSLVYGRPRPAIACGGVVAAVGLLTLIEYIFGVDLGIDQLLMEDYVSFASSHPGRMAPNTALSFALSGAALLVMSSSARPRRRFLISGLLGSVVAALGMVAFFGYLSGVNTAYGWGHLTRMAVHTAAGFALLGAGLLVFAWREGTAEGAGAPRWAAIAVGVGVLTGAVVLSQALIAQERAHIQQMVEAEADDVRSDISDTIEPRILALLRMAKHWEVHSGSPKEKWEHHVARYVADEPGYQAIEWVDPSFHVRWVVPLEGNEAALDRDLAFEERRRTALEAARERGEVTVTRAIDLVQGGKGFLVYVPLFPGGNFDGFMLGVFRVQELLDPLLYKKTARGYSIALFDGEEEIYSRYDASRQHEQEWGQETEIEFYGATWRMRIWPRSEWLAKAQSPLPPVVLGVGLLTAFLVALAVHLAQTARRRTKQVEWANRELEGQVIHRARAEEELRALTGTLEQRVVERTQQVEARRRASEALAEVGRVLAQSLDPEQVGQRVVDSVLSLLDVQAASLYRLEPESENLVNVTASGEAWSSLGRGLVVPKGYGMAGLGVLERRAVATPDLLADPRIRFTPELRALVEQAPFRAALAVPLLVQDRVSGALIVGGRTGRVFTDEEIGLAQAFASQAAIALENARLFAESESRRHAAEALFDIARALGSTVELKQLLKIVTQRTAQAVGAERCSINLWRGGHIVPAMSQFADGHTDRELWEKFKATGPYRLEEVPAHAEAIHTKKPVVVEDATSNSLVPAHWFEAFGIRSALVVPLIHQEEVIGTLNLDRTNGPYAWRQEEIDLAMTIASQAALAVKNAGLFEEAERRRRAAEGLAEAGHLLSQALGVEEVGQRIVDSVRELYRVPASTLYRLELESGDLVAIAISGDVGPTLGRNVVFPRGAGVVGVAVGERRAVVTPDVLADPRIALPPEVRSRIEQAPYRSALAVPLLAEGRVIGALGIGDRAGRVFTDEEIRLVEAFADEAAVALEKVRLYEEIKAARDFLQSIAENSADAIMTADLEGRITYFSPGAEKIFGYRAEEVLGRPAADYYRSGQEEARAVTERLAVEGQIRNYETAFRAKEGRLVEVNSSISHLRDSSGAIVGTLGVMKDITERKRAEEALRQRAERLRVLREIDQAILAARSQETIAQAALGHIRRLVPCNRASIAVFDLETHVCTMLAADVSGESRVVAGARFPLAAVAEIEEIRQGKVRVVDDISLLSEVPPVVQILKGEGVRSLLVAPLTCQDELMGSLNLGADHPGAFAPEHVEIVAEVADSVAVAIQNTRLFEEVRAASERLQNLSRRLVEVQEAERRRIARELHDEIGQVLTGLKLTLEMNMRLPAGAVGASLVEAKAQVNDIIGKVRELSLALRPAMLDDFGLLSVLLWHFERYTVHTNVQVTFEQAGLEGRRFRPEIETAAYRIVQEALTNVARHAGVSEVTVRLWTEPNTLYLQIQDRGSGFDPEAAQASRICSGLTGMRERTLLLDGHLTLESAPGAGTRLMAELPLGDSGRNGKEETGDEQDDNTAGG
ncbi:MAG: GAF domain-containing protein [Candidatus Methylomirabilia bacterium]